MNRLLGGACALVLSLLAAAPAKAGDFKGPYVGLTIGGVSNTANASTTTVFSNTGYFAAVSVPEVGAAGQQKLSPSGFTFGGQFGYNFQHHAFVLGLEADLGSMNVSAQKTTSGIYSCCSPPGNTFAVTQFVGTSYLFTLRPRIGFTAGPVLIYGTGGLAMTSVDYSSLFTDTFAAAHEDVDKTSTQAGWAAGAGIEFKVKKHLSLKGEYLHTDFGSQSNTATDLTTTEGLFPTSVFTHAVSLTGNVYRFGFNYHF
jgi:outer membrane immunogenic protein